VRHLGGRWREIKGLLWRVLGGGGVLGQGVGGGGGEKYLSWEGRGWGGNGGGGREGGVGEFTGRGACSQGRQWCELKGKSRSGTGTRGGGKNWVR